MNNASQDYYPETEGALIRALWREYSITPEFIANLKAANLPEVTEVQACTFAHGVPEDIEALLLEHPELQPVEDFLSAYVF